MAIRSSVPGVTWPAFPDPPTATLLALAWQLEQSQWWSPDELAAMQVAQLEPLLAHARATVPHYAALPEAWDDVPILTRADAIAARDRLRSRAYPTEHGGAAAIFTSRTTGGAVELCATAVTGALWNAMTLREHAWHGRDLDAKLGAIRHVAPGEALPPTGAHLAGWGPATRVLAPDAPCALLNVRSTTAEQVDWFVREAPDYLMAFPSVLDGMLRLIAARGIAPPRVRGVRTTSEQLTAATRALCLEVLGVPIVDVYSAEEVGYLALQCPEHEHYHVMSERLIVEIVRADGSACEVGETGRVVVTDLHNFATPIVRYDLGDYAEVGAPCACGRGLPVLTAIRGRRRNLLAYPDGRTTWPVFTVACRNAARYREMQLVQPAIDRVVARVVLEPGGELTARDRGALTAALHGALGYPFAVDVEIVEELRSEGGKLEEFVSEVG